MKLNEYCEYASNPLAEVKARLVIVPSGEYWALLQRFHQTRGDVELRLSDIVTENAWLPMPDEVFGRVRMMMALTQSSNPFVLLGMPGYLSLLRDENKRAAIIALREWVDSASDQEVVCVLRSDDDTCSILKEVFANPRYRQGKQLIEIEGEEDILQFETGRTEVMLVGTDLASFIPESCDTFQTYLQYTEEHPNDRSVRRIAVASEGRELAGLSTEVRQVVCLRDFAHLFYNVSDAGLSDDALRWLCQRGKESARNTLPEIIKALFFPDGRVDKRVLCVFDNSDAVQREVILWFIKKSESSESYLYSIVTQKKITLENFRFEYIVGAIKNLDKYYKYSIERRNAIHEADVRMSDADIRQFIGACTPESTSRVAPWLNCGTHAERAELLRRCAEDGLVSNSIRDVYPEVVAYLNADHVFGDDTIEGYFREYRQLKMTGRVTPEFYEKAQKAIPPRSVQWRNEIVQRYAKDVGCALLIVDAMGAEWMPMLVALARQRNIGVDSIMVGKANIPTSTVFNSIEWPDAARRLSDIKRFDNIAHNGTEAHEVRRPEENLASALDVISCQVLPRVAEGLVRFDRVLVTADHGSSRLAVLAWQSDPRLALTLACDVGCEVADWRYRLRSERGSCPPELEESLDGKHWVVRGYNRLPKKGGGQGFELHGGATLEERLVPIVIFSKSGQFVPKAKISGKRVQIVEKDDFDL